MLRLDPARPRPGIEQRQHPAGRVTVQSRSTRSSAATTREDDVANTSVEVDQFMARLEHPLKEGWGCPGLTDRAGGSVRLPEQ
jgi:hypothetical protein